MKDMYPSYLGSFTSYLCFSCTWQEKSQSCRWTGEVNRLSSCLPAIFLHCLSVLSSFSVFFLKRNLAFYCSLCWCGWKRQRNGGKVRMRDRERGAGGWWIKRYLNTVGFYMCCIKIYLQRKLTWNYSIIQFVCMQLPVFINIYTWVCMYICTYVGKYVWMYLSIYSCMFFCVYVFVLTWVYVRLCNCIYVYA